MTGYGSVSTELPTNIESSKQKDSRWGKNRVAILSSFLAFLAVASILMITGRVMNTNMGSNSNGVSTNLIETKKNKADHNIMQLKAAKKTRNSVKKESPLRDFKNIKEYNDMRSDKKMGVDVVVYDMCGSYYDDKETMKTQTFDEYCFSYLLENTGGSSCECDGKSSPLSTAECTDKSVAASGGADFVKYYEVYRYQSSEESTAGELFDSTYSYEYEGTTFNFESAENKAKFMTDPSKYIPAYGGFCTFGITMEYCGFLAWDATCLGPSGDLTLFEYHNDKLYLFYSTSGQAIFRVDPDTAISLGDSRWNDWFGNRLVQSTSCTMIGGSPMAR